MWDVPTIDRGLLPCGNRAAYDRKEPIVNDITTYVALDVHKKEHKVAMLLPGETTPEEWVVKNQEREIIRMVKRIKKRAPRHSPIVCAYEAGCCGFALQRKLTALGVICKVIAPSLIPIKPGERVKTDRRDARKLVFLLKASMLTEIHPPNEQEEAVRDLSRLRQAAQEDLTRIKHQVSKLLLRYGFIYHDGNHWTQKHHRWIRAIKFNQPVAQQVFVDYLMELEHRLNHLQELDKTIEKIAQEKPYKEPIGWLRCFRGIDTVTALGIVAELHGFERFDDPGQLMSFLGLTPSENSSGEKQRKGPITKAGNKRVRRLLVEAAWHQRHIPAVSKALKKRRAGQPQGVIDIANKAQRRLYSRYWHLIHQGKPHCKAVTAVARELAGFIWAVMHTHIEIATEEDAA